MSNSMGKLPLKRWFTLAVKQLLASTLTAVFFLSFVSGLQAGNVTWNMGGNSGDKTYNLNDAANWTGGFPANGSNVFMVISATTGASGSLQTITNAAVNTFFADTLSITNTASRVSANITFSGQAFLTNGVGRLNFAGTTGSRSISLAFNSNLTVKAVNFTGGGGSGNATLTLAGATAGGDLIFNGSSGNNFLIISGTLGLSDTLFATNINATSAGTISGNATVGRLFVNNTANGRFTITNSTATITGAVTSVMAGFTLANNATLTLAGTGGLVISNVAPTINGTMNVSNSTLNGKTVWSNNGTITVGGGTISGSALTNLSTRSVSGFGTLSNILVNAGAVTATNGELRLGGGLSGAGTYRAVAGGTGSTLTFAGGGSISALFNTGATVRIEGPLTNTLSFVNQGTVTLAGGTYRSTSSLTNPAGFVVSGFGRLDAPFSNAGTLTATNGQLNLVSAPIQTGTINVPATGILNVTPAWTNNGAVLLSGGTIAGGDVTNLTGRNILGWGTVSNLVVNLAGGAVTASNDVLNVARAPIQNGTVNIHSTLNVLQSWLNSGTVNLFGGELAGSTLTNAGTIKGFGSVSSSFVNLSTGVLTPTNGMLSFTVAPVQNGTVNMLSSGTLNVATAWQNSGTINLLGGTIIGSPLANLGTINGRGAIVPNLNNSGTIIVSGVGLAFSGLVTNSGLIQITSSAGTFSSAIVNSGQLSLNSATAVFGDKLTITASGTMTADAGSVLKFRGDLVNNSTQSNSFDLSKASVFFDGGGGINTQQFTVAGIDLGATLAGFTNNYAIGSFNVGGSTGIVELVGLPGHALYLSNLTVFADSTLLLNGLKVYTFEAPSIFGSIVYDGGSLEVIPEPSTLGLMGSGLLLLVVFRRKNGAAKLPA